MMRIALFTIAYSTGMLAEMSRQDDDGWFPIIIGMGAVAFILVDTLGEINRIARTRRK
jgi:hypothetical protein